MTAAPPPTPPRPGPWLRLLRVLPTAIAVLWIAGFAQFHDLGLGGLDFAVLIAAAFALQVVMARLRGPERQLVLPAGANPTTVALLAAMIAGTLTLVLGGVLEGMLPAESSSSTPWWLRTVWHGACAFAASYCRFLARLGTARRQAPPGG
ncbi:MAG: hypothetical protein AB7O97_19735 [Planctomycetota bacterium]